MDVGKKAKQAMSYFTQQPSMMKLLRFANVAGVVYFYIVSCLVLYINLYCILPVLLKDNDFWLTFHWWFFAAAAAGMFVNYFICLRCKSVYASAAGKGSTDEFTAKGWDHCVPCQQYIPPRAHHCPICKHCILKRDRHCFFLGVCVGHFNQRYFLVFLFYATVAALHAAVCFFAYLNANFAPLLSTQLYNYLYPISTAMWILGFTPSHLYGTVTLSYMCLMLGIGCAGLFYFHFQRALRCQTSYEHANRITTFNRGPQRNLQEVFGSHWWLAFLLPIPMKQTSDGIVWNKPKEIKGI